MTDNKNTRIKRKQGRPKSEPTFIQGFRTNWHIRNFLDSIDNKSKFINMIIQETPEFKAFLAESHAKSKDRALFN